MAKNVMGSQVSRLWYIAYMVINTLVFFICSSINDLFFPVKCKPSFFPLFVSYNLLKKDMGDGSISSLCDNNSHLVKRDIRKAADENFIFLLTTIVMEGNPWLL